MATTRILLREDVDNLGGRGEVVIVRAGYARNYLLPKGIALLATKGNIKQIEQEQKFLLVKASQEKNVAEQQLQQMKDVSLSFERLAGENGALFGSVTSIDVADALAEKGYEIDRRKIVLRNPIKELGEFIVPVKLHREVTLEVPVTIRAEGEEPKEAIEVEAKGSTDSGSEG